MFTERWTKEHNIETEKIKKGLLTRNVILIINVQSTIEFRIEKGMNQCKKNIPAQ